MSPLGQKLASTWLREKAMDLRNAASRADKAYSTGGGYEAARYVADKYRKAAVLLDDAATLAERSQHCVLHRARRSARYPETQPPTCATCFGDPDEDCPAEADPEDDHG
jgi:hypothetical protein